MPEGTQDNPITEPWTSEAAPAFVGQGQDDPGQSGDGNLEPGADVDAYVKSLGMDYNDELDLTKVDDAMLSKVTARFAEVNPEATRRHYLRHSDYSRKTALTAREAEARGLTWDVAAQNYVPVQQQAPQAQTPGYQPPPDYDTFSGATDPEVVALRQKVAQFEQVLQQQQLQQTTAQIEQGIENLTREHPDMTAPGMREKLVQFMAANQIMNPHHAYMAMNGPELITRAGAAAAAKKAAQQAAPSVPPAGTGPGKAPPPKTEEDARRGIAGFFKKHGKPTEF